MRRNVVVSLGLLLAFVASAFSVGAQDANCGLASRFEAGMVGRVLPGDANRVRAEADRNSTQTGTLPGGHYFRALDGVACSGGFTWRQIEVSDGTEVLQGWTVEGTVTDYFVEALPYHGYGISYDGVSFFVPEVIGDGATVDFSPATLINEETRVGRIAQVQFTFTGEYPDPEYNAGFNAPSITIYRSDAYDYGHDLSADYRPDMYEETFTYVVEELETILDEQSDLTAFQRNLLPDLSPGMAPGAFIHLDYADFQNGSGYHFITYYGQDMVSPGDGGLTYRYVGLTELGSYFVVVNMPVNAPSLPAPFNRANGENAYLEYVDIVETTMNAIPFDQWLPDLNAVDAMVNSLVIGEITDLTEDPFDEE